MKASNLKFSLYYRTYKECLLVFLSAEITKTLKLNYCNLVLGIGI